MPRLHLGAHCPRKDGRAGGVLRRLATVGFQQSAQTLNADDFALMSFMLRLDDPVEALVNPLMMIVREILREDVSQLVFRGEDEVVETRRANLLSGRYSSLSVAAPLPAISRMNPRTASISSWAASSESMCLRRCWIRSFPNRLLSVTIMFAALISLTPYLSDTSFKGRWSA